MKKLVATNGRNSASATSELAVRRRKTSSTASIVAAVPASITLVYTVNDVPKTASAAAATYAHRCPYWAWKSTSGACPLRIANDSSTQKGMLSHTPPFTGVIDASLLKPVSSQTATNS